MSHDVAPATAEFPAATILGYPRIGPRRELKVALERCWSGATGVEELERTGAQLRARTEERLLGLGLRADDASVPSAFSFYDQVLDVVALLGAVPDRFADLLTDDGVDLAATFVLARGVVTRPVLVGPVTFLLQAKAAADAPEGFRPLDRLVDVVAAYADLLRALATARAPRVQLDEPALVLDGDVLEEDVRDAVTVAYGRLAGELVRPARPALCVTTPYGGLGDGLPGLAATGVEAVAVDLVRGASVPLEMRDADGRSVLAGRTLVAGVVDGRNVWRTDLDAALDTLDRFTEHVPDVRVTVATSASLQYVPHTVRDEESLDPRLRSWLAFADEKVEEVVTLAGIRDAGEHPPSALVERLTTGRACLADRCAAPGVHRAQVRERVAGLSPADRVRGPAEVRREAQRRRLDLPPLATTTIGSFPQTSEIRRARTALRRGELSPEAYEQAMRAHVGDVVALQERLGLDVLVHGEPERNDMVQYFAELLEGFAVTEHGWVQSYGSRCTRSSVLWGDVARAAPMTILAWSFVRDDQPLADTARQVALALRDEVADLEAAGIRVVQVDEPALRELLPLRSADRPAYLDWSVDAFRLATAGAGDGTQVHTHLCYSEFGAVIEAIDALDADVTSIEAARSRMEVLRDVARVGFSRGVGPGVYDIHSPRVPTVEEIESLLLEALRWVPADRLWVRGRVGDPRSHPRRGRLDR